MQLTNKQIQFAQTIDRWVHAIEKQGGSDTYLLDKAYMYMPILQQLMDISTHKQMYSLCVTYSGLYRFAKLMENLSLDFV